MAVPCPWLGGVAGVVGPICTSSSSVGPVHVPVLTCFHHTYVFVQSTRCGGHEEGRGLQEPFLPVLRNASPEALGLEAEGGGTQDKWKSNSWPRHLAQLRKETLCRKQEGKMRAPRGPQSTG